MDALAVAMLLASACCLAVIGIRSGVPAWGGLTAPEARRKLGRTDKRLAWAALVLFVLFGARLFASV